MAAKSNRTAADTINDGFVLRDTELRKKQSLPAGDSRFRQYGNAIE